MKKTISTSTALFAFIIFLSQCSSSPSLAIIDIFNSSEYDLSNSAVEIELSDLTLPFDINEDNFVLLSGTTEIPYQLDDLDKDGKKDILFFQIDIKSQAHKKIAIAKTNTPPSYTKYTDGVLKVRDNPDPNSLQVGDDFVSTDRYEIPADLVQDNGLVFLEGPAWESDLIGYRFYIDDRTRFDIFGKTSNDLVLNDVSGNYHEISDWGADILSVGSSLGMASPAIIVNDQIRTIDKVAAKNIEIISNGPLRSIIRTSYSQWDLPEKNIDIIMDLEIHAHQRYTKLTLVHDELPEAYQITTGLVRNPVAPNYNEGSSDNMKFVYNWGDEASYHNNPLGKALIASNNYEPKFDSSNDLSFLLNLNPSSNKIEYYFLAAWGLEPEAFRISTESEFSDHVKHLANQLSSPLEVSIQAN